MNKVEFERHKHLPYIYRIRKAAHTKHQTHYNRSLILITMFSILWLSVSVYLIATNT